MIFFFGKVVCNKTAYQTMTSVFSLDQVVFITASHYLIQFPEQKCVNWDEIKMKYKEKHGDLYKALSVKLIEMYKA